MVRVRQTKYSQRQLGDISSPTYKKGERLPGARANDLSGTSDLLVARANTFAGAVELVGSEIIPQLPLREFRNPSESHSQRASVANNRLKWMSGRAAQALRSATSRI
ncbi:MAG TPA: hypothetical protein VF074_23725 [Pyrinomonadaceae bacterium]